MDASAPNPPRFPLLWGPAEPAFGPRSRSLQDLQAFLRRLRGWKKRHTWKPGLGGRPDPLTPWAERIQTFYGHQMPGTATTRLSADLWTTLSQQWADERLCRELWDGFWRSGVLPGDLAPLDAEALGRKGNTVVGLLGLAAGTGRAPLATPADLLELQAPLALLACRFRVPATDAVARTWLGAWGPSRASRNAPQHAEVDLSRARYILSTTGWPPAMVEEAALHLWEAVRRAETQPRLDRGRFLCSAVDPWLVLLNAEAPQAAHEAMLRVVTGSRLAGEKRGATPAGERLGPAMAIELARRLSVDLQRQVLRGWLKSPDQAWREAGVALLGAQVAGERIDPGASSDNLEHRGAPGPRLRLS